MTRDALSAIRCPQCGGAPDPGAGPGLLARCASCGVLGRIDTGPAPPALAALPAVAPGALPEILAAVAQASGHVAPRVARADLLFVPYWRATAVIAGHVAGRRTRRETCIRREADENGQFGFVQHVAVEEEKDVAREVQRVQTVLVSGCPLEEFGLTTLDRERQMTGRLGLGTAPGRLSLVVFHPELEPHALALDPLVTREQALDEVAAVLERTRAGLGAGLTDARIESEVLSCTLALVYYPVYACEVLATSSGTACVDAVTGEVLALRLGAAAPRAALMERQMLGIGGLLAGFASGALARAALFPPEILRTPDAGSFRARVFVGALALGIGAGVGIVRLVRRMERA